MKLKQILEATHHAHHPILSWLSGAFKQPNAHDGIVKIIPETDFEEIRELLNDQLGEPMDVDGNNTTWRASNKNGEFYLDLQDMFGVTPQSRFRLTVTRLGQR
jgi:hypothetical protein